MTLHFRVKELLDAKGWKQAELARRTGLRPATIVGIVNNRAKRIDMDTLEKIADALGVAPGYLIVKEGRRPRS